MDMHIYLSIHHYGHLSCFHFLDITNDASVNIHVQDFCLFVFCFCGHMFSFLLHNYLEVELIL